jgi:hypothetical protein
VCTDVLGHARTIPSSKVAMFDAAGLSAEFEALSKLLQSADQVLLVCYGFNMPCCRDQDALTCSTCKFMAVVPQAEPPSRSKAPTATPAAIGPHDLLPGVKVAAPKARGAKTGSSCCTLDMLLANHPKVGLQHASCQPEQIMCALVATCGSQQY